MGLAQRVIEASGIATVTLSWIPDLTRAVGVPRLAGISHPAGRSLGRPHDADGQRAVLQATLALLADAKGPDHYVELPFQWAESPGQVNRASRDLPPSPIAALLRRKPWLLPKFYAGRIPEPTEIAGTTA